MGYTCATCKAECAAVAGCARYITSDCDSACCGAASTGAACNSTAATGPLASCPSCLAAAASNGADASWCSGPDTSTGCGAICQGGLEVGGGYMGEGQRFGRALAVQIHALARARARRLLYTYGSLCGLSGV